MNSDPWIGRWLPLVKERAGREPILELGCGAGEDTATLVDAGLRVVAIDLSSDSIEIARKRTAAEFHCRDLREPFPVATAGVIVASLSLHYFPWGETLALAERIRSTLQPGGLLLCRLNSTNDHHFGASGHPRLAENYYNVDGHPKRFFDRRAVDDLFANGWHLRSVQEFVIHRYAEPKAVWEVIAERSS